MLVTKKHICTVRDWMGSLLGRCDERTANARRSTHTHTHTHTHNPDGQDGRTDNKHTPNRMNPQMGSEAQGGLGPKSYKRVCVCVLCTDLPYPATLQPSIHARIYTRQARTHYEATKVASTPAVTSLGPGCNQSIAAMHMLCTKSADTCDHPIKD